MNNLKITEIIDNMVDELGRARDIVGLVVEDNHNELEKYSGEDGDANMLCSDIDTEWERIHDLKERIEFALICAVYAGYKNAQMDYEHDCDNAEWREKYLKLASEVELEYEEGYVDSEWAYEMANYLVKELFE